MKNLQSGNHPRSIRDACICKTQKLLLVAPHPDDFDAIGGTLKFLSGNGNPLNVIVACTGSGVEDSYCPGATLAEKAQLREKEQRDSLRFFGLPENCLSFLHFKNDTDDQAMETQANIDILEKLIMKQAPDIIFLPHGNDTNSAHRAIYCMVRRIASRSRLSIALLLIRDPKTISMRPDLYFPFGEAEAGWKAELLRFHDSQQQRNLNTRGYGFDERILKHNRQLACELSLNEPYAEAFELEVFPLGTELFQ
jgi:LmbE family N-acetylglucosaminyl deacetylase